jgi:hypothetical protein
MSKITKTERHDVLESCPIALVALTVWRFLRHTDEYLRLLVVKALAFAAGLTMVVSMSWIFLKNIGAPNLPIEDAGLLAMAVWVAAALWYKWRERGMTGMRIGGEGPCKIP